MGANGGLAVLLVGVADGDPTQRCLEHICQKASAYLQQQPHLPQSAGRAARADLVVASAAELRKHKPDQIERLIASSRAIWVVLDNERFDETLRLQGERLGFIYACSCDAAHPASRERLCVGDLVLDQNSGEVTVGQRRVRLTPQECKLLRRFMEQPGRFLPKHTLLQECWGARTRDTNLVEMYVARLRRKLEANPRCPARLQTRRGFGYRLVAQPA